MSIFKKITLLFLLSLSVMVVIGFQIDRINTQRLEAVVTQKYLQDAKKIFRWMATMPDDVLEPQLATLNLTRQTMQEIPAMQIIVSQPHSFGEFAVVKSADGDYCLYIRYIDDEMLLSDERLQNNLAETWLLNILVLVDIAILVIIFMILLKMLSPLKQLTLQMQQFSRGDYTGRLDITGEDEIAEVADTYNQMARSIENLIVSRQELLRDIGHELRTPISRGLFALETLEASSSRTIIQKSLNELERLSSELLEMEKLQATENLKTESFQAETLIIEALSRLIVDDESKLTIEINDNFTLSGDLDYLALALKNLIDNAIKYATTYPVLVQAEHKTITVKNSGTRLAGDIESYFEPFTREESARQSEGFGLGLNIVKKVLDRHGYALDYRYENGMHRFSIDFHSDVTPSC